MTSGLLLRGMIAGLVAGLLAFGFARVIGEPQVELAIALEEQMAAAANEPEEPPMVTRDTQAGSGLFVGVVGYSVAMGGVFALVFAGLYGRIGGISPRALAGVLGVAAFLVLIVVPELKYAPNPPAVGNPDTINVRTGLFFIALVTSIFGMASAFILAQKLAASMNRWNATIVAAVAYVFFMAVVYRLLPTINEVPENFPAITLYNFRVATLGLQVTIWATISLLFGYLAETLLLRSGSYRPARLAY